MSYSFWCSKCKISHSGECAQLQPEYPDIFYPQVGTIWKIQDFQPDGRGWGIRIYKSKAYRVFMTDKISGVVEVQELHEVTTRKFPIDWWDQEGVTSDLGHYRLKFIRAY